MAKIDAGGEFGQSVVQPTGWKGTSGVGAGLAAVGGALMRIGEQRQNEAERELQQANERADAAAAYRIMSTADIDYQEAARDIGEQVRLGKLPRADAQQAWKQRAQDLRAAIGDNLPQAHRDRIAATLDVYAKRYETGVADAVRDRARDEAGADLSATLASLSRLGGKSRSEAVGLAEEALKNVGPAAGLDEKAQGQALQRFKESAASNEAKRLIRAARDDMGLLNQAHNLITSERFADLSPQALEQLETQITNRRAQLEHAKEVTRARAEAAYERRVRSAERAVDSLQGMIDAGGVPDDNTLATVQGLTAGTPLAPVLKTLVGQARERANFGSLPPDQQRAKLLELRASANAGTSPEGFKRLQTFESIATKQAQLAESEPLKWGLGTRLLDQVQPLVFDSVDQLVPQLAMRVQQAQEVGAVLKRPVSPLLSDEAQRTADVLSALPAPAQARVLGTLAARMPVEQQRALAAQIAPKDRALSLAMFASTVPAMVSTDVPAMLLRGADARRSDRLKSAPDSATAARDQATIAQQLSAVPWPTPQARDAAVEAAQLLYDAQRDAKKSGSVRDAIKLATGGGLTEWGDSKVPLPPGWDEDRFRRRMRAMDAAAIQRQANGVLYVAGAELRPEALAKALGAATLVPMGPGRYAVDTGGALVTLANGRRLVLDVTKD